MGSKLQERWFRVTSESITYYKGEGATAPKGKIRFGQVQTIVTTDNYSTDSGPGFDGAGARRRRRAGAVVY